MSSTYAGNPATFPATVTIPDDGDARNAASVNVPLEGLADRTANLNARTTTVEAYPRITLVRGSTFSTSIVTGSDGDAVATLYAIDFSTTYPVPIGGKIVFASSFMFKRSVGSGQVRFRLRVVYQLGAAPATSFDLGLTDYSTATSYENANLSGVYEVTDANFNLSSLILLVESPLTPTDDWDIVPLGNAISFQVYK